jgi:hypothetical protein
MNSEQTNEGIPFNPEELYETRLVVCMETAPQSNKYFQIMLNKEQFKAISDEIGKAFKEKQSKDGHNHLVICGTDFTFRIPEKVQSHYTQEEIDKSSDE